MMSNRGAWCSGITSASRAEGPVPSRYAETRDRAGDHQIFSLTLSQLSFRGNISSAQRGSSLLSRTEAVNLKVGSSSLPGSDSAKT